jgi:superfamily II DNA/RNA helicase
MTDSFEPKSDFAGENTALDATEFVANVAPETTEPAAPQGPNPFAELGLADELVRATIDLGYTTPTSVQLKTIPLAMQPAQGKKFTDLMVSSQTGSGKTAAFLLPVLHTLQADLREEERQEALAWDKKVADAAAKGEPAPKRPKRQDPTNARNFKPAVPGALILCPTRELAQQVAHDAIDLVRHVRGVRVASVVGGMPYQLQIAKLQNASLVVATPGRLLDLQRSGQIQLDKVKFLVVDEADRMLDLGFSDDLAEVNQLTIERQQTMMFSATFASRIQQLASRVMREPQRITIDTPQEKHANIKQVMFWADNLAHKRKLLDHWLRDTTIEQAIVFSSTQVECDQLAQDLYDAGFSAVALHGALSQGLRNRRLMMLREGRIQILVATDVAARGIDVPSISHVFNYGLPMKAEDYTHRIGRTGRAGRNGLAVTFAEFRDRRKIDDIVFFNKQPLPAETIPGLEPTERPRAPARAPGRGGFGGGRGAGGGGGGFRQERGEYRGGNFGGGNSGGGNFGGGNSGGGFNAPRDNRAPRNEGFGAPPQRDYSGASGFNQGFGKKPAPSRDGMGGGSYENRSKPAFDARRGDDRGTTIKLGPKPAGKPFAPRGAAKRPARPAR